MKPLLIAAITLGVAVSAHADPADPLWMQAQAHAVAARAWVAQTVRSETTADDSGPPRSATATAMLAGWDGSTPRRRVAAEGDKELAQMAQRAMPRSLNPGDRPDAVLLEATSVARDGPPQPFEGRLAQAFTLRGTTGRQQTPFSGRVRIDAATGDPMTASYELAPSGLLKALRYTVHFAAAQAGQPALPDSAELQVEASVPLLGRVALRQVQQLATWVVRPAEAQVPPTSR